MQVAVAASGGRDSTALLHCTARIAARFGGEVHALHVNHGLMPQAGDWQRHLAEQVRRWRRGGLPVQFHAVVLDGSPPAGASIEAWARKQRYAVLARLAREAGCEAVLLAHHRTDQAETWLLQALRGGGVRGWAAMPHQARRDGLLWLRPWLDQPRTAIDAYVARHRLRVVDDPSNADLRLDRSRLRREVWPALTAAFPQAELALAAAARRAAEAAACLADLARADATDCVVDGDIVVARWEALDAHRRANLLRHWLAQQGAASAPESLIQRLMVEVAGRAAGRWPLGEGWVSRHRGRLAVRAGDTPPQGTQRVLDLSVPGRYPLPEWGGSFIVRRAVEGLDAGRLRDVRCRARAGGERFSLGAGRPARSLKKQFQALAVAPWQRRGPLLFDRAGELLFVPGLGLDARCRAGNAPGALQVDWQPDGRAGLASPAA